MGLFCGGENLHFIDGLYQVEEGFGAFGFVSDFRSGTVGLL